MYEEFAKTAEEEGFHDLAVKFREVGKIENITRKDIVSFFKILKQHKYLKKVV
ncbi:Rubrerythrin [Candidatus Arthromitus sp. SFB-5]|nr:Rubrerythrin [Candidatus Arthromitus sp. SFB-5]